MQNSSRGCSPVRSAECLAPAGHFRPVGSLARLRYIRQPALDLCHNYRARRFGDLRGGARGEEFHHRSTSVAGQPTVPCDAPKCQGFARSSHVVWVLQDLNLIDFQHIECQCCFRPRERRRVNRGWPGTHGIRGSRWASCKKGTLAVDLFGRDSVHNLQALIRLNI